MTKTNPTGPVSAPVVPQAAEIPLAQSPYTISRGTCPGCGIGTAAPAGLPRVTCAHCGATVPTEQVACLPPGPYPYPPVTVLPRQEPAAGPGFPVADWSVLL